VSPSPAAVPLLRDLGGIEARRDTLIAELEGLPAETRVRAPEPGVWSPNQVVEHLVAAERFVLRSLFHEGDRKSRPRSLKNRILHRVVVWILRSPIPVKVPVEGMDPTGGRQLSDLVPEWRETHGLLRDFLENASPADMESACFMHPVAGPLTPGNAVEMMGTHLDRHAGQIRRRLG
jgi:hypothetical protein